MSEKITWEEIYETSNEELADLLENEKNIFPDEVDTNTAMKDIEGFKNWVSLMHDSENYFLEKEMEKDDFDEKLNKEFKKSLAFSYGSVPVFLGLHEALHAAGAKLTGGNVYGFGWDIDSVGFSVYTLASTPNLFSDMFCGILPNFVIPALGFYSLKKGKENLSLSQMGVGLTALYLHLDSFFYNSGDFYKLASYMADFLPNEALKKGAVLLGAGLAATNYAAAYGFSNLMDKALGHLGNFSEKLKE